MSYLQESNVRNGSGKVEIGSGMGNGVPESGDVLCLLLISFFKSVWMLRGE